MSDEKLDRSLIHPDEITAIAEGRHGRLFAVLGQHASGTDATIIRVFHPKVDSVTVLAEDGRRVELECMDERGLFAARIGGGGAGRYKLKYRLGDNLWESTDPYSMPSCIGELDRHLAGEGTHQQLYRILGSHVTSLEGVDGVHFATWAPNATRVSVVGDFNDWDGRRHVMRSHPGSGLWDMFIPELRGGTLYKFELHGPNGELLPLKHDPYASYFEQPPGNASIVFDSRFVWRDEDWLRDERGQDMRHKPVSVYEMHAGSWRHGEQGTSLSYRELAEQLVPYLVENGFTHVELMPITEHPYAPSWGYQPIGLYAPTSRFGSPDDFRWFVDSCHVAGIGVIMDWVPAHFPSDEHGLGNFDGTHLYEHADPRQGFHQDWNTLIYNFGRREVANYLLSNAVYWVREFHLDGLRVDAVASMLYLDYSRNDGEWIPNQYGGRENLEAIAFLKRMNELVHAEGAMTLAEESTSFPRVSHPTWADGLGFTFKWNMGWMHDILEFASLDPAYRKYHHDNLTFGMIYAFSENFLLPFSHDEVVYGKGSMIGKMPGDEWQKFANLRALYTMMFTYPGKKLNFMGSEFAQNAEWAHDGSLHWHLLEQALHSGMQALVRDLNALYKDMQALHETDCDGRGFEWIDCQDSAQSIISYYRYSLDRKKATVTVCNFTPIVRYDYRIGVDKPGRYMERLNSDARKYGGSGTNCGTDTEAGSGGSLLAREEPHHERPCSLELALPPLGVLVLELDEPAG